MQRMFARIVNLMRLLIQLFRLEADFFFFLVVAPDFLLVELHLRGLSAQPGCKLREMALGAFRLVKIPLVRSFGFFQYSLVFEQHGFVLCSSAKIRNHRADCRQDRGENGNLLREARPMMCLMLETSCSCAPCTCICCPDIFFSNV